MMIRGNQTCRLMECAIALALAFVAPIAFAEEKTVDYTTQIKPLLQARCYACHGALKQQAGLRLDTAASIIRGGESGPAIARGDAEKSLLVAKVSAKGEERMPPESEGEPLSAEQIALLRAWITAGASAPGDEKPEADPRAHWAFQPIVRPQIPLVRNTALVRNPIDAFVARQHAERGLAPQPEAPRLLLLRRLTLDLVGVPPSLEEIAACQNNTSPDWYERTVERLLSDPRHGQRWARHWMDIWRYSDPWGLGDQLRNSQPHIWHWRDWIVESVNADIPYDEMVRLMLAADELHPNDLDKLRASGFLARNYFLFNRNHWLDETVEHVSKSFLGLTVNCAKCHDHKYDPIAQADYYRLRAFFEPYHVRIDMLPGESDLARDGIARAFDGALDAPTYRFIRGQENQPDKSQPLEPGVPAMLAFRPLEITSVGLPVEASQPDRRPWVAANYLSAAKKRQAAVEADLAAANSNLAAAQQREADVLSQAKMTPEPDQATPKEDKDAIVDAFAELNAKRWKLLGGEWMHKAGRLEQKRDGATRAAAQLLEKAPRDFDATLRFTILGGSQWRSVGISFDATQSDITATANKDDSEQSVYVSAYAGGPKVQAAFQRGGNWEYPPKAMSAQPIKVDQEYTLRVQVRDALINASLDGKPVVAWRTPLKRREGSLLLTTFDALAVFHEVTIAPLAADAKLIEPGGQGSAPLTPETAAAAVAEAKQALKVAELARAAAQAEVSSVERRAAAMRALDMLASDEQKAIFREAARAEREFAVARARQALAEAELRQLRAAADKREAAVKEVEAATKTLATTTKALAETSEQFTRFAGAKWSATRFRNSGADDPNIPFPVRSTGRRKALAAWITDKQNPLTARVAVNHLWTRHFGAPLVPTVFDFGRKRTPPANQALLDWLAAELVESGWSMKHVHRLILQSATYRLSTSASETEGNLAKDPENLYLWRRTPQRLESQAVRDSILALAGTLDLSPGGPPVPASAQNQSTRRSLYFYHSNNERNLFLTTFDEALVKECYRREQSIVPQQALALSNSALVLDSAPQIAKRLSEAQPDDARDEQFIKLAFIVLLGAEPTAQEIEASAEALAAWRKLPGTDARAQLVWVLLNHNDFVTVR
jgi:mono/diheme cytochrome c family protein